MKNLLRALCLLLCFAMFTAAIPKPMFGLLENYQKAKASGDEEAWRKAIEAVLEFAKDKDYPEKADNISFMYKELGQLYEKQGEYDKAVQAYLGYLPYFDVMNWEANDKRYAENKVATLSSTLEVFVQQPTVGGGVSGKFTRGSGIMFGTAYDRDPRITSDGFYTNEAVRKVFTQRASSALIYCDFGTEDITGGDKQHFFTNAFKVAAQNNEVVIFAWNIYNDVTDIEKYASYIDKTLKYLQDSGCRVIVRWGGEMNVDSNIKDAKAYVKAYRYIADKIKNYSNLANVWSPNSVSAADKTFLDFYPGDEYVDWIGVSLYVNKVFAHNENDSNDTMFLTGDSANPVLCIQPIIQFMEDYQIKKPLMLSECGVSHSNLKTGEKYDDWAAYQLAQMYTALPRLYPQLKLINYFNVLPDKTRKLDYSLFNSQPLTDMYNELTSGGNFIKADQIEKSYEFVQLGSEFKSKSADLTISAVAYLPKTIKTQLKYHLDGKEIALINKPPYEVKLTALSKGEHTLRVQMYDGNEPRTTKEYKIIIE